MKKLLFIAAIVAFFGVACKETKTADNAKVEPAKEVKADTSAASRNVDVAASTITWIGSKVTGKHNGTFSISKGNIDVKNNQITGGNILIDIKSIKAIDSDPESNGKLQGHLLAPDFFDAEKFPTASFVITSVAPYQAPTDTTKKVLLSGATHTITGNLTLKDKTNSVSIPAIINMDNATVTAKSTFTIDRTLWGMSYGADKSLKDKMIYPEVTLGFDLIAK